MAIVEEIKRDPYSNGGMMEWEKGAGNGIAMSPLI